jgi:L-ascorbate metabolism protein UlaG (beta-lactamase superfamily)
MKIKWLGHSCFKIASKSGVRILTDPFDDNVGYKIPSVEADIVTVSHGHYDHNFTDCVKGDFDILSKVGNFNVKDIPVMGVHTYHDDAEGTKRGDNIVYTFQIDGLKVCHLGDLGHILSPAQVGMIGRVDILLIPVGGNFTLDALTAVEVVNQLKPSIVIPMHYKTPALMFNLENADKFIEAMGKVEKLNQQVIEINPDTLNRDETKVYILKYE